MEKRMGIKTEKKEMKKKKNRSGVEILAPAGSIEALRAAIGAGADAVYMGGVRFGARAYADNLEQDAMCAAIDYVHLHGRRIYLTVNTLLKPAEMGGALYHYLKPYYEQGIDAVIVQDAGVLEFIAREFPGLPIHASTQMSLTMAAGAKCFENYPVTRLVNARELGLSEIRRLREQSALEIESFVHGALCYCYSGQCLMSSLIGGRSGNRGRCAQPCRLEYDGTYLLSPKDICTLDMIPELIEAGIDSFKIEGRMKRYEYAAGVTAAYRTEVDRYFELGEQRYREFHRNHPEVLAQAFTDMQDLYNRGGFTKGYYGAHNGRTMMSMARPNHSGVQVARVEKVSGNRALLLCRQELHAQDVLEIRMGEEGEKAAAERESAGRNAGRNAKSNAGSNVAGNGITVDGRKWNKKEEYGKEERDRSEKTYEFTLGQAHAAGAYFEAKFTPGLPVRKGDFVYRTKNSQLLEQISKEYFEKEQKIAAAGKLTARVGEAAELTVYLASATKKTPENKSRYSNELSACVQGGVVQCAQKQPMSKERLRAALQKTGDTPFSFSELEVETTGDIFIPVSALNALRREALKALEEKIAAGYRRKLPVQKETAVPADAVCPVCTDRKKAQKEQNPKTAAPPIHVSIMTDGQFSAVLSTACVQRIYYDLAALPVEGINEAAARAKKAGKEFFLRLPRICRADAYDILKEHKSALLDLVVDGYLLQNYEELFLFAKDWRAQEAGKILVADAMLYVMNAPAKEFFARLGVAEFTAPYEENAEELGELGVRDMALTVYGRLPLMVSAQCVHKNRGGCEKNTPVSITDRKNKKLPVQNFCRFCYNVIYSSECLALFGCEELKTLAPAAFRYDFTFESEEEVLGILEKQRLPKQVSCTLGHFRRGVM